MRYAAAVLYHAVPYAILRIAGGQECHQSRRIIKRLLFQEDPMFLQLDGISFSYPESGCALFSGLSLSFSSGWTVIAGPNGVGKSTLVSIASGVITPDAGIVRRSGEAILCPQVFDGLSPDDWADIFSGDNHVGMLRSTLAISDEMIWREDTLSGGERKRLQLLAALSHSPEILILDEPTNHLDSYSRDLIVKALHSFDGIGIIVSHDRAFASALSSRTVILQRGREGTVSAEDIPLPLPEALDESDRRKKTGRESYESILSAISAERMIVRNLGERSRTKQKSLTKRGLDSKDHDAKAAIDGARLTGKDASLDGAMRNHLTHARQLEDKLAGCSKPLMRKEGLSLASGMYVPDISFPETMLRAGEYSLAVPSLSVKAGEHIAIMGRNGSGKTLFLKSFHEHLLQQGKERFVLYIPQEFSEDEKALLLSSFMSLADDERGLVLSDLYRLGSEPSSLFSDALCPSPGEMKKLAIAMARRDGRSVLLMDEPTNHLDIISMRILERMIREDGRDMTVLLVSHDEAFLAACTDTVWRVERNGCSGRLARS